MAFYNEPIMQITSHILNFIYTDHDNDGIKALRIESPIYCTVAIYLTALISMYKSKSRTASDDRHDLYSAAESRLESLGLDGRACLLRFTCELHRFGIEKQTVMGNILSTIFSPGIDSGEKIKSYRRAELDGRKKMIGSCYPYYNDCPISLFSYISLLNTGRDAYYVDPEKLFTTKEWKNYRNNSIKDFHIPQHVYDIPNDFSYKNQINDNRFPNSHYNSYKPHAFYPEEQVYHYDYNEI